MFSENAFGMELNTPDGMRFVADAHDFSLIAPSRHFETIRHTVGLNDQGMITRRFEGSRQSLKQFLAVMFHRRSLSMHHAMIDHHVCSVGVTDALMSQADTERGNVGAEFANDLVAEPGFPWGTRAGGNQNSFRFHPRNALQRDLVVAMHFQFHPHFTQILDQIECERVVIVDNEDHIRKINNQALLTAGATLDFPYLWLEFLQV